MEEWLGIFTAQLFTAVPRVLLLLLLLPGRCCTAAGLAVST